jgi:hypothetical protein
MDIVFTQYCITDFGAPSCEAVTTRRKLEQRESVRSSAKRTAEHDERDDPRSGLEPVAEAAPVWMVGASGFYQRPPRHTSPKMTTRASRTRPCTAAAITVRLSSRSTSGGGG